MGETSKRCSYNSYFKTFRKFWAKYLWYIIIHFSVTNKSNRKHKRLIDKTKKYSVSIHNTKNLFFLKYVCISNDWISSKTSSYRLRDLKGQEWVEILTHILGLHHRLSLFMMVLSRTTHKLCDENVPISL